jgi:anti-sigma regulatory factor (Ser/Thr protein kinase)
VGFKQYRDVLFAAHELLINSVQAMNQKYKESCPYVIKIEAKANPDIAELSITDYGGGLPEGLRESLEDLGFEDILAQESGRGYENLWSSCYHHCAFSRSI